MARYVRISRDMTGYSEMLRYMPGHCEISRLVATYGDIALHVPE